MKNARLTTPEMEAMIRVRNTAAHKQVVRETLRAAKQRFGIPVGNRIRVNIDDTESPLYGVIVRKRGARGRASPLSGDRGGYEGQNYPVRDEIVPVPYKKVALATAKSELLATAKHEGFSPGTVLANGATGFAGGFATSQGVLFQVAGGGTKGLTEDKVLGTLRNLAKAQGDNAKTQLLLLSEKAGAAGIYVDSKHVYVPMDLQLKPVGSRGNGC